MKRFATIAHIVLILAGNAIVVNAVRSCGKPSTDEQPPIPVEETIAPDGGRYPLTREAEERVR